MIKTGRLIRGTITAASLLTINSVVLAQDDTRGLCGQFPSMYVNITFDPAVWDLEPVFACGVVMRGAWQQYYDCSGNGAGDYAGSCVDSECSSQNLISVECAYPFDPHGGYSCGEVNTWPPGGGIEIKIYNMVMDGYTRLCGADLHPVAQPGAGWGANTCTYRYFATAVRGSGRDVNPPTERDNWLATLDGTLQDPASTSEEAPGIWRAVCTLDDQYAEAAWLWYAGTYRDAYNMTLTTDPLLGQVWAYTLTFNGGTGEFTLIPSETIFQDETYDVTGYLGQDTDGRFNTLDVDAFATHLIGSVDPNDIERWDFNGNGAIEGMTATMDGHQIDGDQAYLVRMIELGLDSGVFGDLNGDDVPDCQWRSSILGMFGYVLGDAEYRIGLDYDLDGDTDNDDLDAFALQTCPWDLGDANCSGVVGFDDVNAFVDAVLGEATYYASYPDCEWLNSDVDCDGTVGMSDINPFVDCIAVGVCTCPVP